MKRTIRRTLWILLTAYTASTGAQNLLQNPGFESPEGWDRYWVLAKESPSTESALAVAITSDVVEGTRCVQLSNSVKLKWTYLYSDTLEAPITLRAGKKYEVKGWIKVLEMGKDIDLSMFWNGSAESYQICGDNPDPTVQPDWYLVKDTIYPQVHCSDAYLRLGFRSDKDGLFPTGRLLLDHFSVKRIPEITDADITGFILPVQAGETEIDYVSGTVRLSVPAGTDLTSLAPVVIEVSEGAGISPSPDTPVNFTTPVLYTVTARDGTTTQEWSVEVDVLPNTGTDILSFTLPGQIGGTKIDAVSGEVALTMPYGSDLSSVIPEIEVSAGANLDPAEGTAFDFTAPVSINVTAEDGSTLQQWTVTVTPVMNQEADILAFSLAGELRSAFSSLDLNTVVIDPDKMTVQVVVPYGTDVTSLVPDIVVSSGATIDPAGGKQTDFTGPRIYRVTAQDGVTVKDWTVTVEVMASSAADITGFSVAGQLAPASIDVDAHAISLEVAPGSDLTAIAPVISVSSGATVTPSSGESIDFSSGVVYTVTAEDGTTLEWMVTILMDPALSAEPVTAGEAWRLYPNPASTFVMMDIGRSSDICIQDLQGKVVTSLTAVSGHVTIPVSHLHRGLYLVTVRSGAQSRVTKLILE